MPRIPWDVDGSNLAVSGTDRDLDSFPVALNKTVGYFSSVPPRPTDYVAPAASGDWVEIDLAQGWNLSHVYVSVSGDGPATEEFQVAYDPNPNDDGDWTSLDDIPAHPGKPSAHFSTAVAFDWKTPDPIDTDGTVYAVRVKVDATSLVNFHLYGDPDRLPQFGFAADAGATEISDDIDYGEITDWSGEVTQVWLYTNTPGLTIVVTQDFYGFGDGGPGAASGLLLSADGINYAYTATITVEPGSPQPLWIRRVSIPASGDLWECRLLASNGGTDSVQQALLLKWMISAADPLTGPTHWPKPDWWYVTPAVVKANLKTSAETVSTGPRVKLWGSYLNVHTVTLTGPGGTVTYGDSVDGLGANNPGWVGQESVVIMTTEHADRVIDPEADSPNWGITLGLSFSVPRDIAGPFGGEITVTTSNEIWTSDPVTFMVEPAANAGSAADDFSTLASGYANGRKITAQDIVIPPVTWGDLPEAIPVGPLMQRHAIITPGPRMVVGGKVIKPPRMGAICRTVAHYSTFDISAELAAAESLGLSNDASGRWQPDASMVVDSPPDGVDASRWNPSFGDAPGWIFRAASAPYVDPDFSYYANHGRKTTKPAMVFDGTRWALGDFGNHASAFTAMMVVVIRHPTQVAWSDLLSGPLPYWWTTGGRPETGTALTLRYHNGHLAVYHMKSLVARHKLHLPSYQHRRRPVIIAWGQSATHGVLGVVDTHGRRVRTYAKDDFDDMNVNFALAVNSSKSDTTTAARLQLLDFTWWDSMLSQKQVAHQMHRMHSVYGVAGT